VVLAVHHQSERFYRQQAVEPDPVALAAPAEQARLQVAFAAYLPHLVVPGGLVLASAEAVVQDRLTVLEALAAPQVPAALVAVVDLVGPAGHGLAEVVPVLAAAVFILVDELA
jgi:phage tail protein X